MTTSHTHTPGPWRYDAVSEGSLNIHTGKHSELRSAGFCITAVEPKMFGGTRLIDKGIRSEADARLIATAPELLDALRSALMALDRKQPSSACACDANLGSREQSGRHATGCPVGVIMNARAAIAKAVQS